MAPPKRLWDVGGGRMNDETRSTPTRSIGAIVFGLVLLAFATLIVVSSLGLRPGVGSVPLLVGIPTTVGIVIILVGDLLPGRRETTQATFDATGPLGGLRGTMAEAAAADAEEDEGEADELATPEARRRQLLFTAWVIGFVVLATLTSFYVAVPIALVAVLAAIGLRWLPIVLIVLGTVATFYGLFDTFLGVRL